MIRKPLDSLAKIVAGQSPESSTYNSTGQGLPFFQGKADFQDMYPTVRMWCTSEKRKLAEADDILISVRAPVGAVNICNQKSIIGRGLAAIRPLSQLDGKFLYYYLKANERQIDALGTGSTFKAITQYTLKNIEVPVPPLDDQIRIAHLLGKVEGLIAQRKQHLQQLDDLLKSVFLEMFGDPVRNEKGWEKKPCSMVADIITGHPFKSDLYTDDPTQLRLCGGLIIYPQRIDWDKCNYWPKQLLPRLERYLLEANDIVLAMDRPWISSGLKICTVDAIGRGSLLVQRTARLRAKDIEQYFLYAHLKDLSFTRHCKPTETTVPHISIKDIQTFQVLCPPKQLQTRFASIAEKIEGIKSRYQQSLNDLEALYGALSQQAFKGELDLSRVPMQKESAA
jgi:type I restriction enzyme S subunit